MTSRHLLLIGLLVVVAGVWWASGLGRTPADPRSAFTQQQIERARDYHAPKYAAWTLAAAADLALLSALVFTKTGQRLLQPIRSWPWLAAAAATAALVVLTRAIVRLPFSFWSGFLHERAWGFSTQSAVAWFGDWGRSLAVSAVIVGVVFVGFAALVRALPRGWPGAAAAGAAVLVAALSFLWPLLVEPLFNRFTPLENRELAVELSALADRAGVPISEVLVSDASRRTTKENAYVSGFGASRRLVLYDTLLERADDDEVALVVAHELGHRREGHVEKGALIGMASAAGVVGALWLLSRSRGLLSAAGAEGPGDPRFLLVLALFVAVFTLATLPPSNWLSRRFETSADRFALELTGDRETYVRTERGLALRNLSDLDPGPLVYRFLFTHPAPAERIAIADR